jgi:LysR family transcriptional regulator, glycine cleavage system transcriptional activator
MSQYHACQLPVELCIGKSCRLQIEFMPKRRLPNLSTLPGFEAAARHLSFTLAAAELHLTQGAISRQVRELELFLGRQLFRRFTRRIELTEDGVAYARVTRDILAELERATARFGDRAPSSRKVVVSILPTLASLWLMPRLHLFTQSHREIEVRVVTSIEPADLMSGAVDVAVRVGSLPGQNSAPLQPRIDLKMVNDWTDVQAFELFPDILCPVCSPNLLAGQSIDDVRSLLRLPLIHTSTRRFAWPDWLAANGVPNVDTLPGSDAIEFGHFFMSLEAARKGQGVAIVPDIMLAHYEGRRDLVSVAPAVIASAGTYCLLVRKSRSEDPEIRAFRSWVIAQSVDARSPLILDRSPRP